MSKKYTTSNYLVIVESPAKCNKIEKILGPGYKVIASYGHLRELTSIQNINIDNNFSPTYTIINNTLKKKQIEKTKSRFDRYGKAGLLCGTDGLPHLIADGRWSHSGEFVIPGIFFLYIAGWIGWVGRSYVLFARTTDKPTEKEIIIDVPVALSFVTTGFIWPISAFKEFTGGRLLADESEITVSPR